MASSARMIGQHPVSSGIAVDRECLARVAAYATRTGIADFRYFVGVEPPFNILHFAAYLHAHGRELLPGVEDRALDNLVLVATDDPHWCHSLYWDASRKTLLDCQSDGIIPVREQDFTFKCWLPITART